MNEVTFDKVPRELEMLLGFAQAIWTNLESFSFRLFSLSLAAPCNTRLLRPLELEIPIGRPCTCSLSGMAGISTNHLAWRSQEFFLMLPRLINGAAA